MRQLVGALVEFGVGQSLLARSHGDGVRGPSGPLLEQLRDACAGVVIPLRGVPVIENPRPLVPFGSQQVIERPVRVLGDRLKQRREVARQPVRRRCVENVAAVPDGAV